MPLTTGERHYMAFKFGVWMKLAIVNVSHGARLEPLD